MRNAAGRWQRHNSGEPSFEISAEFMTACKQNPRAAPPWPAGPESGAGCLQSGFEAHAARQPNAVAVTLGDQSFTYGDLNARASRLAHFLRQQGVGPETIVGLCLERSFDLVVGVLGILKAGGAYLPLDPLYPKERKAFILANSKARLVLTHRDLGSDLARDGSPVVQLETFASAASPLAMPGSGGVAVPENLAYVIYTSGSTGQPKGVMVEHRQAVRLFTQTDPWFQFGPQDVWTLFHSAAFDFSVWEIWGALLFGGRLVIVPYWESRSPEEFLELLRREQVTVLNQTPSAFSQLVAADEKAISNVPLALRYVIFGGEALALQSLRPWFARHGDACPKLVNMYGITETTVHVTYRPLRQNDLDAPALSPIGGSIPDLRVRLMDPAGQLVSAGTAGEMGVTGAGLARGYLANPQLTAERFVPDPFSTTPGERLYRSGDLARYGLDGGLEYLGRIDDQVKIRGFRIELGEVEAVLGQHAAVQAAVVISQEDAHGDKRLVAYWVPRGDADAPASELRRLLRAKLPEYMVPALFVRLERLPLTTNGKVDRRALPMPPSKTVAAEFPCVEPRTELEQIIRRVWQSVLQIERCGIHENFFDLGGHSLKLMQAQAELKAALRRNIDPVELFQFPTISSLAAHLSAAVPASRARMNQAQERARRQRQMLARPPAR